MQKMIILSPRVLARDPWRLEETDLPIHLLRFWMDFPTVTIDHQDPIIAVESHAMLPHFWSPSHSQGMLPNHREIREGPEDLLCIGSFHGVSRITEFPSHRGGGRWSFDTHRPIGYINHVGSPISH